MTPAATPTQAAIGYNGIVPALPGKTVDTIYHIALIIKTAPYPCSQGEHHKVVHILRSTIYFFTQCCCICIIGNMDF